MPTLDLTRSQSRLRYEIVILNDWVEHPLKERITSIEDCSHEPPITHGGRKPIQRIARQKAVPSRLKKGEVCLPAQVPDVTSGEAVLMEIAAGPAWESSADRLDIAVPIWQVVADEHAFG